MTTKNKSKEKNTSCSPKKAEDTSSSKEDKSKGSETSNKESEERFVRDLLIRGEAAKPGPDGELPPDATHKIVEDDEEGELPKVERERFSIY